MQARWFAALVALAASFAAAPSQAGDGVVEINQACVTQGGCFSSDVAGFPVTIDGSAGHSYRLSSDLVVPYDALAPTPAIEITGNDVSLDLAGFAIRGANTCSGTPTVCTIPDDDAGYGVSAPGSTGVEVANGSVVGMTSFGIDLGPGGAVRNVRASQNSSIGVVVQSGLVSGSTTASNGGTGILVNFSTVSASTASDNGFLGMFGGAFGIYGNGTVSGSTASGNTAFGIIFQGTVTSSTASGNGNHGIAAEYPSTVTGSAAFANQGNGINSAGALLIGNSVRDNLGAGVGTTGSDSAYRENSITSNTGGTVVLNDGPAIENLGDNFCTDAADATVACP